MPARRLRDVHFLVAAGVLTVILAGAAAVVQPSGTADADSGVLDQIGEHRSGLLTLGRRLGVTAARRDPGVVSSGRGP